MSSSAQEHEHKFIYAGLRYRDGGRGLPGTSARPRYYAHVYYCEGCLEKRAETVETADTTYEKPRDSAVLGGEEVPMKGNTYGYGRW